MEAAETRLKEEAEAAAQTTAAAAKEAAEAAEAAVKEVAEAAAEPLAAAAAVVAAAVDGKAGAAEPAGTVQVGCEALGRAARGPASRLSRALGPPRSRGKEPSPPPLLRRRYKGAGGRRQAQGLSRVPAAALAPLTINPNPPGRDPPPPSPRPPPPFSAPQVNLAVHRETSPGQDVWLVGSAPALGEWDLDQALALAWTVRAGRRNGARSEAGRGGKEQGGRFTGALHCRVAPLSPPPCASSKMPASACPPPAGAPACASSPARLCFQDGHVWRATIDVDLSAATHIEYKVRPACGGAASWQGRCMLKAKAAGIRWGPLNQT
jgi:hypothetical protein